MGLAGPVQKDLNFVQLVDRMATVMRLQFLGPFARKGLLPVLADSGLTY